MRSKSRSGSSSWVAIIVVLSCLAAPRLLARLNFVPELEAKDELRGRLNSDAFNPHSRAGMMQMCFVCTRPPWSLSTKYKKKKVKKKAAKRRGGAGARFSIGRPQTLLLIMMLLVIGGVEMNPGPADGAHGATEVIDLISDTETEPVPADAGAHEDIVDMTTEDVNAAETDILMHENVVDEKIEDDPGSDYEEESEDEDEFFELVADNLEGLGDDDEFEAVPLQATQPLAPQHTSCCQTHETSLPSTTIPVTAQQNSPDAAGPSGSKADAPSRSVIDNKFEGFTKKDVESWCSKIDQIADKALKKCGKTPEALVMFLTMLYSEMKLPKGAVEYTDKKYHAALIKAIWGAINGPSRVLGFFVGLCPRNGVIMGVEEETGNYTADTIQKIIRSVCGIVAGVFGYHEIGVECICNGPVGESHTANGKSIDKAINFAWLRILCTVLRQHKCRLVLVCFGSYAHAVMTACSASLDKDLKGVIAFLGKERHPAAPFGRGWVAEIVRDPASAARRLHHVFSLTKAGCPYTIEELAYRLKDAYNSGLIRLPRHWKVLFGPDSEAKRDLFRDAGRIAAIRNYEDPKLLSDNELIERGRQALRQEGKVRYDRLWNKHLALLKDFVEEMKRLPRWDEVYRGFKLGRWCNNQRDLKVRKERELSAERIAALKSVKKWSWKLDRQGRWKKKFDLLQEYVDDIDKKGIPKCKEVYKGVNLGEWCDKQRRAYRAKTLPRKRIAQLQSIKNWSWSSGRSRKVSASPKDRRIEEFFPAVSKLNPQAGEASTSAAAKSVPVSSTIASPPTGIAAAAVNKGTRHPTPPVVDPSTALKGLLPPPGTAVATGEGQQQSAGAPPFSAATEPWIEEIAARINSPQLRTEPIATEQELQAVKKQIEDKYVPYFKLGQLLGQHSRLFQELADASEVAQTPAESAQIQDEVMKLYAKRGRSIEKWDAACKVLRVELLSLQQKVDAFEAAHVQQ